MMRKGLDNAQILINEPMRLHTTFAVGGPADVLILPHTSDELALALRWATAENLPITVLGGGSNVLVLDGGIRGVVIQLNDMRHRLEHIDNEIIVSTGYILKDVAVYACCQGLSGLEFAVGIPGTLGGAVFMNAGAYDGEMSTIVKRVSTVDCLGTKHYYEKDRLRFTYRHSIFQDNNEVISEITLSMETGDSQTIQHKMDELTHRRASKQPLEMHSAGSTFKRPSGNFAGTLIEKTGLKGLSVGDAQVSTKHAGFVINLGNASAKDILALIHEVQLRVKDAHGVELEPEVRIIGSPK